MFIINQYLQLYESKAVFFTLALSSSNFYFHIINAFCTLKLFEKHQFIYCFNSNLLAAYIYIYIYYTFSFNGKRICFFSLFMALILF